MADPDLRWRLRFANFERAFLLLETALAIPAPSVVEQAGLIQFFEMTFELAWKLLKDYEEAEGFQVKTPREVLKQAFQSGFIDQGQNWLQALQDRNLLSHTYSEHTAVTVEAKIRETYFPLLAALYQTFLAKLSPPSP
ncbi:MAG: nucleotidyltransferase substrate binding protein [Cyanobacteriota bacterium]|nr:nucleotidyltransferase substrate binding protein [Cyanobacteriota bacterium]